MGVRGPKWSIEDKGKWATFSPRLGVGATENSQALQGSHKWLYLYWKGLMRIAMENGP